MTTMPPPQAKGKKNTPDLDDIADSGDTPESEAQKRGYTIWTPSQILEYKAKKDAELLTGGLWAKGDLAVIVGQGGLGKSRLVLWFALCAITGRSWLGLNCAQTKATWLLIGNENSIIRQQNDLSRMMRNFSGPEQEMIEARLRIHVVHRPEDADLDLTILDVQARLRATLEVVRPDVIVFDPWGALTPDEDKGSECRAALNALFRAKSATVPDSAILILAHARTGAANVGQAAGWSKANFLKGSKVLYSTARFVVNFAPGDPEDNTRIVMACGKANNGPAFRTRGIIMDPDTFSYSVDPDFDLGAWQDDVDGRRKPTQKVSIQDVIDVVRDGLVTRKEIVDQLTQRTGAGARTVDARLREALKKGYLATVATGIYAIGEKAG